MLPLLTAAQIRQVDAYTIANEPVSSIDLMERASKAFVSWFVNHFPDKRNTISVYCGTGNNGGDGLAIASILYEHGYEFINVKIVRFSNKVSPDFAENLQRLQSLNLTTESIEQGQTAPQETSDILIDAILGSGLNKPLAGDYLELVNHLNTLDKTIVAVDVPTGFYTDGEVDSDAAVLKADLVITFQQPKINFLLPESAPFIKCWEAVNIGLHEVFIESLQSPYLWVEEKDIKAVLKPRSRFSHKGTFGHALIIAGQAKTMGAALLCSSACVYAGAGLTTACIPESGLTALNSYQAEIMAVVRKAYEMPELKLDSYSTIAIGPGLGKDEDALALLQYVLEEYKQPIVVDADALNLLAEHPRLMADLPAGSILTPHMKEFDRLFGEHSNWWQRLQTLQQKTQELNIYIVLKNSYTMVGCPDGKVYFNSTSNAAMAVGGMGDVLTGVITALLGQKYTPEQACVTGVYLHGKAGDELALPNRLQVVLPGQVAARIPATIAKLL
ncbi:NAD(P)H-hydrate dehydratase [Mucilaginibacter galii]|uniref:Bifunctional NAD(P)H-hydrate repair enzyme n=1 Tax=Mucilaginibacter galii TaxID=2005073 RepID=A0A917J680_9SPHI|nr:NAD(P)H-hydrate dehydratase [Mucilaginibacter galii]GGI49468.1 bifunctional NAD(P)H-hydrate repair enzyme [Mucilaginibacter galii]